MNSVSHLLDVMVTVGVVWTLGPLHWISLGYVFDALVFPSNYNAAMVTSSVVGYAAVGAFSLMQGAVKRASLRYDQQQRSACALSTLPMGCIAPLKLCAIRILILLINL